MCLGKNIKKIQIFGDSSLVINWMRGSIQLFNIILSPIGKRLKEMTNFFEVIFFEMTNFFEIIFFEHIYQELNGETDALSKEAQQIPVGTLFRRRSQRAILLALL